MNKNILLLLCVTVTLVWCMKEEDERQKRSWFCLNLAHQHCIFLPRDLLCGTNNYTYFNRCEFSQDHCKNDRIHVSHTGPCYDQSHLYNHTHGGDIVFELMCQILTSCPDTFDEVCASDGRTYMNECEYEMKRCMHPEMTIVAKGPCTNPVVISPY